MILSAFTLFHVVLSLVGIGSGFVVLYGFLNSKRLDGWTKIFLATTVATSATGFLFPFHQFEPSYVVGVISLIVLGIGIYARGRFLLTGDWRRTYVACSVLALYLNFFVLIVPLFRKVSFLNALAPTQSEPPFQIAQLVALVLFAALGIRAAIKFRGEPLRMANR